MGDYGSAIGGAIGTAMVFDALGHLVPKEKPKKKKKKVKGGRR